MLSLRGRERLASVPEMVGVDHVVAVNASVAGTRPLERVRTLLMLGRPRTCVPGLVAFALGHSYTAGPALSVRTAVGALLALSIGFSANLHNAATDLHEDGYNLPGRKRLIVSVGYRSLMRTCLVLGFAMFAGALALGAYFTLFMGLALVGLHQYSAPPVRSKGRPLLGLWVFAQAVVFPFLFGWTTDPGRMLETLIASAAAPFGWTSAPPASEASQSWRYLGMWGFLTLWFMAKGVFKNVPDFDGDRAAGVRTSATICGSRRRAAIVAAAATVSAYLSLASLVALRLEKPFVLLSLAWLGPVVANCLRLVRSRDGAEANRVLGTDMRISVGFIATLLLSVAPSVASAAFVAAGMVVLAGSDGFGLDSRRAVDATASVGPERRSESLPEAGGA